MPNRYASVASLLLSRMVVPVLFYLTHRNDPEGKAV